MTAAPHLNKLPPLSSLRGFEAAARRQSLRKAAEELSLTHAAIAHQIQRLEESLGVKLFARDGRHIKLTPVGERFYPFVRDAIATLICGAETVRSALLSRPLRVQVYVTASIRWLAPRLSLFRSAHPDIELQLMTCSVSWEFDESNADVGVIYRYAQTPSHLYWQKLFDSRLFPVCSPDLLASRTSPLSLTELKNLPLIAVYTEDWSWDGWFHALESSPGPSRKHIGVDTLVVALEMAIKGEGVVLVNGPFADDDIASGRLIKPVPHIVEDKGEWGVVCHRSATSDERISTFINWLDKQAAAHDT